MPHIEVNGQVIDFPDTLSPDELNSAVAEAADQIGGSTPEQGDPGAVRSLGLGLMSGIPGAETAATTIKSKLTDRPYEDVHNEIEGAKKAAWSNHPVAYGGGKTASTVGTGVLTPEGIPAMAVTGAAYGTDAAERPGDIPKDAVEGGFMGAALGKAGEYVGNKISAIGKKLPDVAKNILAGMGKDLSRSDIDFALEKMGILNGAMDANQRAQLVTQYMNEIKGDITHGSANAMNMLDPKARTLTAPLEMASEGVTAGPEQANLKDNISPIFDEIKKAIAPEGIGITPQHRAALSALDSQKQALIDAAATYGGAIPERRLGEMIQQIRSTVNPLAYQNQPDAVESQQAIKKAAEKLRSILGGQDPKYTDFGNFPYHEEMQKVAPDIRLNETGEDVIKPNLKNGQYTPSDTTNRVMGSVMKPEHTEVKDFLSQLQKRTGFDFLGDAQAEEIRNRFMKPGTDTAAQAVGGLTGMVAGGAVGHPYVGGFLGRQITSKLDGGWIAKGIIQKYLNLSENSTVKGASEAIKKYGPMLVNAAKQGGNNLAATHFVLSTSHPAYQKLVEQESSTGE